MPEQHKPYPPLPAETARAVRNTFHIENLYLLLGDQLPSLLVKVDMAGIGAASGSSPDHFVLLSLVTIFQYVENLPDEKAIELLRTRLDWKYAMHLPLNYPGMEGIQLCDFRRQLLSGRNSHESFQQILEGIKETSLMGARDRQTVKSVQLVNAVCRLSRLENLAEAMIEALEAAAVKAPEILRKVTLPHWYHRYSRRDLLRHLPYKKEEQETLAACYGKDAIHFLQALEEINCTDLLGLPEIEYLRMSLNRHFKAQGGEYKWHPNCKVCRIKISL